MQHRRGADAQLQVAAQRARDPRRAGDVGDLDRPADAAVLARIDAEHVRRLMHRQLPGVGQRDSSERAGSDATLHVREPGFANGLGEV